jgi:hypothetical protein
VAPRRFFFLKPMFKKLHDWAINPVRPEFDVQAQAEKRDAYRKGFRWLRAERLSGFCRPFIIGHSIGWQIASPIDITFFPIEEFQFQASETEAQALALKNGFNHLWERDGIYFGVATKTPIRMFDYVIEGGHEAMFVLNGEGTLEWRLGFEVQPPSECGAYLMDDPTDPKGLCLPGFFSHDQIVRLNAQGGLSLAVKPTRVVKINRGDIIARLLLLPPNALAVNTTDAKKDVTE